MPVKLVAALLFAAVLAPRAIAQGRSPDPTPAPIAQRPPASAKTSPDEPIPASDWQEPPRGVRPVARWWWPGGSVEPRVLERHLREIADAGFGAVEVQPLLLGFGAEDVASDPKLRTVGQPAFLRALAHAAAVAGRIGLDLDLTLGSGWPGGLPMDPADSERQLLMATMDVKGPTRFTGPLPDPPDASYRRAVEWVLDVLGPPDEAPTLVAVLAGRLTAESHGIPVLEDVRVITAAVESGQLRWDAPAGTWRIFALYEGSTGHFVMGGAYPGLETDARVVDHLTRRGADALIDGYGDPALAAIEEGGIREIFVDSFELMGELPFTGALLSEFRARAGYDPTPHLPLLFRKGGESKYGEMIDFLGRNGGPLYVTALPEQAQRIREDYEDVRRTLFEERFIGRLVDWAHDRGAALRLQAHGGFGDYLDTYARADVPESEALFAGGSFDFLKLAASAAHVTDRQWVTSESFITLRLFGTRLTDDEMRMLAGRAYSAGINRLVFHGVPYPYERADGEVWYPFSGGFGRILAGPLPMSSHIDPEALAGLPDLNRFLGRLSLAMSRGRPVAEVAWLRAAPDHPDAASLQVGRIDPRKGESATTAALRARGLVHDRVSRRMLAGATAEPGRCTIGARHYRALLLDPIEIAEPALAERIAAIAEAGVPVLSLGALPRRAPGLGDAAKRDGRVRAAAARLADLVIPVQGPDHLEALLREHVKATLVEPPQNDRLAVSLERRRTSSAEILLMFNESWQPEKARLRFTRSGREVELWDPRRGTRRRLRERVEAGELVALDFEAAETLILTVRAETGAPRPPEAGRAGDRAVGVTSRP